MPLKVSADSKFEIGHVLFIDIVGYSKLLIEEQKERLADLTRIVLGTAQVRDSTDEQLVRLPTGASMEIVRARNGTGFSLTANVGPNRSLFHSVGNRSPPGAKPMRRQTTTTMQPASIGIR